MKKYVHELAVARAALTLMENQGVFPAPANYELFYTYAGGKNSTLSRAVDTLLKAKVPFTPEALETLRRHLPRETPRIDDIDSLSKDVSEALGSVLVTLEMAGKDAASYGSTLSSAISELVGEPSPTALRKLMEGLLGATHAMEARTKLLEDELRKSSEEVNELKSKLDDVRKESLTDPLTSIPNRKLFEIALDNAIKDANEEDEEFSLCMCDIDHFKIFNDTWGHQTGDQVLRLVGACLSENVKGRDTAARYGGEEFAVILRQTKLEHAVKVANQIREHVESKKLVKKSTGDILGNITISIGVAQYAPGETAADLIRRADACLYAAKNAGRNRVVGDKGALPNSAAA